jgi:phospholipid/cholesterol/gamma-HCH transport system substrate-binding protein
VEQITGTVAAEREEIAALIRNARSASERLETTLANADRTLVTLDQGVVQELPALVERLDRTLAQLESASKNADGILSDNREAIAAFSNDGLGQVGPTMRQMRSLIRELDDLAGKVQGNPAGFLLGREQPEEFDP